MKNPMILFLAPSLLYFSKDLLPKGFRLGPIESRHLSYIRNILKQDTTIHSGDLSDESQEILLKESFTGCLYNVDGKPISWGFADLSGEILDGFTDPVFRGQRFGKIVNMHMEQEAHRFGQPHVHRLVATDNMAAQLATKSYLKPLPQIIISFHYVPHTKCKY